MSQPRSRTQWLLEGVSLVALVLGVGMVPVHWHQIPQRIATHFNAAGAPDNWGDKNVLIVLAGFNAATWILLTFAERFPGLVNVPFAIDRSDPEVQTLLRGMVIALKTVLAIGGFWLMRGIVHTAFGNAQGIGGAFLPALLVLMAISIVWYTAKLWHLRKPVH